MAGITLAQAETELDHWLTVLGSMGATSSYGLDTRSKSNVPLDQIQAQIEFWDEVVDLRK
jgi:hypothetical protein